MSRTFYIKTMGCQMNEYDSDLLAQKLIKENYAPVEDPLSADIILINTCAVRAKPEQKAASFLGRMCNIKKKNPDVILGIMGCMAQKEGASFFKRFPLVDLVMGPRELDRIAESILKIQINREKVVATDLTSSPPEPIHCKGYFKGKVTEFISIMEGCNNFCSYCIVPYVRGREVSRSPNDILAEAENLIADGVKDITLLGQNVISYVHDNKNIVFLLRELNRLKGLFRLRFTTSHPKDLSDEIIQCFGDISKLCPHIHLPFQSGSNAVLKGMKRGYTRETYLELPAKLREVKPDIAITSDVIVGFPGETEEDFEMTLNLLKQVQFDGLFSFKYSDRKGTLAAKMPNKVDESVKSERLKILQAIQKKITLEKNIQLKGSRMEVLIEGLSKMGGQLTGRTETNKVVNLNNNNSNLGDIVKVSIKESFLNSLLA